MPRKLWKQRLVYLFDKPRPIWWAVAVLLVTGFLLVLVKSEQLVRLWGMALQLVGVVSVLMELRQLQDRHSISFRKALADWLEAWPTGSTTISVATGSFAAASSSARASLRTSIDPTSALESQVTAIGQNLAHMDREIDTLWRSLGEETRSLTTLLEAETAAREESHRRLRDASVMEALERLPFAYLGQLCLLLGIVLGSAASDIAGGLKWPSLVAG